jgi:hypothetical protein
MGSCGDPPLGRPPPLFFRFFPEAAASGKGDKTTYDGSDGSVNELFLLIDFFLI